jgi:tRNA 2-thiouridine synthesizing protein A
MANIIDARGFSCPQPVLMTLNAIKSVSKGEIVIMVDTDTARENVSRAAGAQGWAVSGIEREAGGYRITIGKEG